MSENKYLEMFQKSNALLSGHFELSSGKHSDQYFQCALVLQYPKYTEVLAQGLASQMKDLGVELVIGPALGGVVIAYELGRQLGVPAIFSERKNGEMLLRRGFSVTPGQKIVLVEDVITTGGSVLEVAKLVEELGGEVVAIASIVNRSPSDNPFPYDYFSLFRMIPQVFEPNDCELCQKNIPITKPGSKKINAS